MEGKTGGEGKENMIFRCVSNIHVLQAGQDRGDGKTSAEYVTAERSEYCCLSFAAVYLPIYLSVNLSICLPVYLSMEQCVLGMVSIGAGLSIFPSVEVEGSGLTRKSEISG